ncbi:MAG: hypothetical protein ACYS83_09920, partial [Planctomycetota bacterium]
QSEDAPVDERAQKQRNFYSGVKLVPWKIKPEFEDYLSRELWVAVSPFTGRRLQNRQNRPAESHPHSAHNRRCERRLLYHQSKNKHPFASLEDRSHIWQFTP